MLQITLIFNYSNFKININFYVDNQQQSPPDAIDQFREYINKMGIITKAVFCINVLTYIVQGALKINMLEYVSWLTPIAHGQFYRIIASIFSHANLIHIAFNMASLVIFSPLLELHNGTTDYLIINLFLYNVVGKFSIILIK